MIIQNSFRRKPIRILLVVRNPVGGIRTFLRYVYRAFGDDKWRLTLLAPDSEETRVLVHEDLKNIHLQYIPTESNPSNRLFTWRIAQVLREGDYDIVHSHGFTSAVCAALGAKTFAKCHILTSHDVVNAHVFKGFGGRFRRVVVLALLRTVDTIHSVGHDAQDNLLANFPRLANKKLSVIPNGIEIGRFSDAVPRDLHRELNLDRECMLIGFAGRFMSQKGFRYLVDAVELIVRKGNSNRRPFVLAFGHGGFIREEQEMVSKRNLSHYFRFLPFVPNIGPVIKGLDVVVIPSLWEACPLLPMEVLVSGTPLISSDCVGLREVVRNTPTTVVPARDSARLARAIWDYMENDKREIFAAYAAEAKKRYDVQIVIAALQDLYDSALAGP